MHFCNFSRSLQNILLNRSQNNSSRHEQEYSRSIFSTVGQHHYQGLRRFIPIGFCVYVNDRNLVTSSSKAPLSSASWANGKLDRKESLFLHGILEYLLVYYQSASNFSIKSLTEDTFLVNYTLFSRNYSLRVLRVGPRPIASATKLGKEKALFAYSDLRFSLLCFPHFHHTVHSTNFTSRWFRPHCCTSEYKSIHTCL